MKKLLFILGFLSLLSLQGCFVGRPWHGGDHRGGEGHEHHDDHR